MLFSYSLTLACTPYLTLCDFLNNKTEAKKRGSMFSRPRVLLFCIEYIHVNNMMIVYCDLAFGTHISHITSVKLMHRKNTKILQHNYHINYQASDVAVEL